MTNISGKIRLLIVTLILVALAFVYVGCEKMDMSALSTSDYYIGDTEYGTFIIKFDSIGDGNLIGQSYKVEQSPIAEEKHLSVKVGHKKCLVAVNDVELPINAYPDKVSTDSITGEYTLGKERHPFWQGILEL